MRRFFSGLGNTIAKGAANVGRHAFGNMKTMAGNTFGLVSQALTSRYVPNTPLTPFIQRGITKLTGVQPIDPNSVRGQSVSQVISPYINKAAEEIRDHVGSVRDNAINQASEVGRVIRDNVNAGMNESVSNIKRKMDPYSNLKFLR